MDVQKRIISLREKIQEHNLNYYVYDNPTISDSEYDSLLKKLDELEKKYPEYITIDSPTQRVGGEPLEAFESITHRIPLLSLANAMNQHEIEQFDSQIKKFLNTNDDIKYTCEPKIDGLAVELVYENGFFAYGSTRGNGEVGEDITNNLKTIKGIPLKLNSNDGIPRLLEVRGEVFINHLDFEKINKKRDQNNEQLFANPRNLAAGSLRQLDSNIASQRPLRIFCYGPGIIEGVSFNSQEEFLMMLPKWGLPVNPLIKFGIGLKSLIHYYQSIESKRNSLDYDIDGVVFKVNSYNKQKLLGFRSKSPRWAIAGKFKAEEAYSVILDIIPSVGRTGSITPVAILKPINIGGVIVSKATLHNQDELDKKDIRIGDTVVVKRAGDVIPKVIKSVISERPKGAMRYSLPAICPICNEETDKSEDESVLRCPNYNCDAQIKGRIKHFISKEGLDIDGFGKKLVDQLVDNNILKDISDIFSLNHCQLSNLDRMGNKSALNVIESIQSSKSTTLSKFINSLGIRNVGVHASKILDKNFNGNIENLMNAKLDSLLKIHEVGDVMAQSILNYFKDLYNIDMIQRCISAGVEFKNSNIIKGSVWSNKIFAITGSFSSMKRNDVQNILEKHNARLNSSISRNTNFLLLGENPGSKLQRAKDLNIQIINEKQFLDILESI